MNLPKITSEHFRILTVFLIVLALIAVEVGLFAPPIMLKAPAQASARVEQLLSAVHENDYDTISTCLVGSPSLGVDREPGDAVSKLLWDSFTGSFTYRLDGGLYAAGNGIAQDVTVEFLDISSVTSDLNERAQALLAQRVQEARSPSEIYDENNEYREDVVLEILAQAIEEIMTERARPTTLSLTIRLINPDGQWLIQADNALLNAISGNAM